MAPRDVTCETAEEAEAFARRQGWFKCQDPAPKGGAQRRLHREESGTRIVDDGVDQQAVLAE